MMSEVKTIEEVEREIVEEFTFLDDEGGDRNEYIIDLGKRLPPMNSDERVDDNIIKGCLSTVWLTADYKDDKVLFKADSNSVFVKGLISLLIRVLSGQSPDEIINARLSFINDIGMKSKMSMNRGNGLPNMIKQMKNYALAYKAVKEPEKTI